MVLLMPVTTARFDMRGTTAEGYAVAEKKALRSFCQSRQDAIVLFLHFEHSG
jgi:hypothetical protein